MASDAWPVNDELEFLDHSFVDLQSESFLCASSRPRLYDPTDTYRTDVL